MIHLKFDGFQGSAPPFEVPYLRLTAGLLWEDARNGPLARFDAGTWIYQDWPYERIEILGAARLFFGITREPAWISEILTGLSLEGAALCVDTQPLAKYDPAHEVWRASLPPTRGWHSFRIVSADVISALADAEEGAAVAEVRPAQSVTFHMRR
jgi:hypothetical protein